MRRFMCFSGMAMCVAGAVLGISGQNGPALIVLLLAGANLLTIRSLWP